MNLKIVFVCCFTLVGANLMAQDELFNPMKDALKTGNAKEVAKFFNASVDMNVEGNVDTYSKAQAEFVLKDFFKKHPPTEFNVVHTGASKGGQQYAIGRYVSNGENYNVMLRVKEVEKVNLIHEINFVKE
jgi:hypothetical protein